MACCLTAPNHYLNQCWLEIVAILLKTCNIYQQKLLFKLIFAQMLMHLPGNSELILARRRLEAKHLFILRSQCVALQWRHNGHDGVSNPSPTIVYSTVLIRRRSKTISKLRVTGLCAGNSPVTGEFPEQRASDAENVSIWWRHHHHGLKMSRRAKSLGIISLDKDLVCQNYCDFITRWLNPSLIDTQNFTISDRLPFLHDTWLEYLCKFCNKETVTFTKICS